MATPEIIIPDEAPVMVLPGTLLFPHAVLPLYIFEPRYRAMLRWALERDRMFCIALMRPGVSEAADVDDFFHTGGITMIRASVMGEDGTSRVMLQGLSRVRFQGFAQLEPFRIARIETLPSIAPTDDEAADYSASVRELCASFRNHGFKLPEKIEDYLERMDDPDVLADSVAHAFIRDPYRRQQLMEEPDVASRLLALIGHLQEELK